MADLLGGNLSPKLPSVCKLFCLPHEKEISNKAGHTLAFSERFEKNIFEILLLLLEELKISVKNYMIFEILSILHHLK